MAESRPRLDELQRRHRWLGLPIAVVYKFIDDQGSYLAALITYYGFLSLFPLLLLAATVLGFALHGDPALQQRVIGSALSQFPIIGKQITSNVHAYRGSGVGLVAGIGIALYGGLGVAQAAQNAMNSIWAVPRNSRPNPVRSRLKSLVLLATLGIAVILTTALSQAGTLAHAWSKSVHLGATGTVVIAAASAAANIGLFLVAYRFLTAHDIGFRDVALGAVVTGVLWEVLQMGGAWYVAHELRGTQEIYGSFALVLGLLAWIYLLSFVVVFSAELNVVVRRRLWPRALLTPFTDDVDLTSADERAYGSYAKAQRAKGFEQVDVSFDR